MTEHEDGPSRELSRTMLKTAALGLCTLLEFCMMLRVFECRLNHRSLRSWSCESRIMRA